MTKVCKCCGQPLPELRAGVRLPALKRRIFDLVKARPGISQAELAELLYGTRLKAGRTKETTTIGCHIMQINDALEETNVRIRGVRSYGYRLVNVA